MTNPLVLKANRRRHEMVSGPNSMPYLMLFVPDSGCLQHCEYCATQGWNTDKNPLSYQQITDVVNQAHELNVKEINISGPGEPTYYSKLPELSDVIHSYGIELRISTNATDITPELARKFSDNEVSLVIKLHSVEHPEIHNKIVGNPSIAMLTKHENRMKFSK